MMMNPRNIIPIIQNPQALGGIQPGGKLPFGPGGGQQPGAQPLPGGLPPELAGQIPPEMMQQMSLMMQDPQIRAQMMQLEQMARNGQISPDMLAQMMDPEAGLPPELRGITMGHLLKVGLLAGLVGGGTGFAIDRFMNGIYSRNSLLERTLKGVESLPFVKGINDRFNQWFKDINPATMRHESALLRLDGAIPPNDVVKNFYNVYLGKQGHLYGDLRKLGLPPRVLSRLSNVASHTELLQVLESSPLHFLPETIRDTAKKELQGGGGMLWRYIGKPLQDMGRNLAGAGAANTSHATSTLLQLDRLIDREKFISLMQEAMHHSDPKKRLSPDVFNQILQKLDGPAGQYKHAGDKFFYNMTMMMRDPKQKLLQNDVKRLLGLKGDVPYSAIEKVLKAKAGNRAPLWAALQQNSKGLLLQEMKDPAKMTLGQVDRHFRRYHVVEHLNKGATGKKLQKMMGGLLSRGKHLEKNMMPHLQSEHQLYKALTRRNIGPTGRMVAKMGYYFKRIFEGLHTKGAARGLMKPSSPMFSRFWASLIIFGFAISSLLRADKETKIPKFFDHLASGLGGFWGFEFGRSFFNQIGILTRNPAIARFALKRLGPLPFTVGGFLSELVFPAIGGMVFGILSQKVAHKIFGDPEKMKQAKLFEEDKNRPLKSQKGLFDRFSQEDFPKIPGVMPDVKAFEPDQTALSVENVGLTPEQIERSVISDRFNAELNHFINHERKGGRAWDVY